jgi:predicted porin
MKKVAIASAVLSTLCGFSSLAHAQSSVTLYGIVDSGLEYVNRVSNATSVGSLARMQTWGGLYASRWGLQGQEDLGSGLQAFFDLESGFTPNNGALASSQLFNRQSYVGLRKTGIGEIAFGRQYTSMYGSMWMFMPFNTGVTYEPAVTAGGAAYMEDNMVKYEGDLAGVHVAAHYSFGTGFAYQGAQAPSTIPDGGVPGNHRAQTGYGFATRYQAASFGIAAGYDETYPTPTATAPIGDAKLAFIAADYITGPLKFMGGFRWRNSTYGNDVTSIRDNFYWAGMTYSVTPALGLTAGYYYDQVKGASLLPTIAATSLPGFSQVSLMASYFLSKRTTVYIATAYAHNGPVNDDTLLQTGGAYGYGNPYTANGLANGQKNQVAVATGLQVMF